MPAIATASRATTESEHATRQHSARCPMHKAHTHNGCARAVRDDVVERRAASTPVLASWGTQQHTAAKQHTKTHNTQQHTGEQWEGIHTADCAAEHGTLCTFGRPVIGQLVSRHRVHRSHETLRDAKVIIQHLHGKRFCACMRNEETSNIVHWTGYWPLLTVWDNWWCTRHWKPRSYRRCRCHCSHP